LIQDQECEDVRAFSQKLGMIEFRTPGHITKRLAQERGHMMLEEVNEFIDGVEENDLAKMADALIDLVYFAKGTALKLGLPWVALWADVQRANMAKERGTNKRGFKVDAVKPPGWMGPNTSLILAAHGYVPEDWKDRTKYRDETDNV